MNTKKILVCGLFAVILALAFIACDDPNSGGDGDKTYTVTFESDGAGAVPAKTVKHGEKVAEPAAVTKASKELDGWYKEAAFTNKWDFASDIVTANLTLYAKWVDPTLTGITAAYSGTTAVDYTTPIDDLKDDLTVTALYSNGESKEVEVTDYELSGELVITGASDITVTYEGEIDTFTVTAYAVFTGPSAITTFLNTLDANTAETPYNIKLNATYNPWTASGQAQTAFNGKYVNLDLSGTTLPMGIGQGMFSGCNLLTGITIPNSVTSIGENAFLSCTSLTGITIPNGVMSISRYAFSGCTGLTGITIPNGVTSISSGVFSGCTGLTSITIPAGVTSIGSSAFERCTGLASITIPEGVTSISQNTFERCTSLASVNMPEGVTTIGQYAFLSCTSLTGITIPASVTTIDSSAFSGCTGLTSVTIPEGVTTIGGGAFIGCTSLTSVTFAGAIASTGWTNANAFPGDLRDKFYAEDTDNGVPGTYIVTSGTGTTKVWTKQP